MRQISALLNTEGCFLDAAQEALLAKGTEAGFAVQCDCHWLTPHEHNADCPTRRQWQLAMFLLSLSKSCRISFSDSGRRAGSDSQPRWGRRLHRLRGRAGDCSRASVSNLLAYSDCAANDDHGVPVRFAFRVVCDWFSRIRTSVWLGWQN